MKRIMPALLAVIFLASFAYAEISTDESTIQELSTLRKKLGRVKREMDLLMKDILSNASSATDTVLKDFPGDVSTDILQTDKNIIVKADLPGMDKDKIKITLDNGKFLKIAGSREMIKTEKSPGVVRQERFFGNFEKTLELPAECLNTGISATYKDGVLEITIPKKAKTKEETVTIAVK